MVTHSISPLFSLTQLCVAQQGGSGCPLLVREDTTPPGLWHLAKANEPNEDFYREVAARFGGRWLVRSNLRGPGDPEPSSHAVLNIGELAVPGWDHAPYKAGSEHAKMAVCVGMREGDRPERPLVLIGDCNNTVPSHKRGGGGVVVQHPHLWELLRLMAREYGTP